MFSPITNFVKRRHKGLAVAASVVGGSYLLLQYAKQRFQDLSEKLVLDRAAKENLRRRFQQNQEDCAFTLLALLPTLSQQVLEELDVEAITAELQRRSNERAKTSKALPDKDGAPNMQDSQELLGSSLKDLTQEAASIPLPPEVLEDGTLHEETGSPAQLPNGHSSAPYTDSESATPVDTRTKAELWHALKLTTFHRTIASLYLLALLALQTHIQLNLLGRHNYVSSVYKQASHQSSDSSLSLSAEEDDFSTRMNGSAKGDQEEGVNAQVEREYLSMSWWFLQRGWRTVSKRIEESAEEVLCSVGLKSLLSHQDLNKLLLEIRRKIEYEATGAVHSFASALFPTTEKEEQETLRESGLAFDDEPEISPQLRNILSETRDFIDSTDFSVVLRSCLDRVFALLSESLGHLFVDDTASPASQAAQRRFIEVSEKKVRLAAVLPALARASHTIFNGVPNEYAEALADNRELLEFSVVVYSNFQQQ